MRKINIIGDIDYDMYNNFENELTALEAENHDDVKVTLSSEGGLHEASLAIASRIRLSPCDITIIVTGIAASAAALILAYGDRRVMAKEAWVMVHEESCKVSANVSEFEREAKHLRDMENQACNLLEERTQVTAEGWAELHRDTTWLTANKCFEMGLIEEII